MIDYVNKEYKLKQSSVYVATDEVEAENLDALQMAGFKLLKKTALVLDQLQTIIVDLQMMSASQEFLSWVCIFVIYDVMTTTLSSLYFNFLVFCIATNTVGCRTYPRWQHSCICESTSGALPIEKRTTLPNHRPSWHL